MLRRLRPSAGWRGWGGWGVDSGRVCEGCRDGAELLKGRGCHCARGSEADCGRCQVSRCQVSQLTAGVLARPASCNKLAPLDDGGPTETLDPECCHSYWRDRFDCLKILSCSRSLRFPVTTFKLNSRRSSRSISRTLHIESITSHSTIIALSSPFDSVPERWFSWREIIYDPF